MIEIDALSDDLIFAAVMIALIVIPAIWWIVWEVRAMRREQDSWHS